MLFGFFAALAITKRVGIALRFFNRWRWRWRLDFLESVADKCGGFPHYGGFFICCYAACSVVGMRVSNHLLLPLLWRFRGRGVFATGQYPTLWQVPAIP